VIEPADTACRSLFGVKQNLHTARYECFGSIKSDALLLTSGFSMLERSGTYNYLPTCAIFSFVVLLDPNKFAACDDAVHSLPSCLFQISILG
jgi:hypothetical protein